MITWHVPRVSNVALLGYDRDALALFVLWRGRFGPASFAYRYPGVPPELFAALCASNAPGRDLHAYLNSPSVGGLPVYESALEAVLESAGAQPWVSVATGAATMRLDIRSWDEDAWEPICSGVHVWFVLEEDDLWHIDLIGGHSLFIGHLV